MSRTHQDPTSSAMFGHNPGVASNSAPPVVIGLERLLNKKERTQLEDAIIALCSQGFTFVDATHYAELDAKREKTAIDERTLQLMRDGNGRVTYINANKTARIELKNAVVINSTCIPRIDLSQIKPEPQGAPTP